MTNENSKTKSNITIFSDKSVLKTEDGNEEIFLEGALSDEAKKRYLGIRKALESGYFQNIVEESIKPEVVIGDIDEEHFNSLNNLVESVTSEVGRAIIGLTVMQLTLKSINPEQSIRLHKGSNSSSSFSWKEGIPMRVLDKNFITPILRHYGLLKLNADGFMMTRTLAENYPYSKLYKAAIRGAKDDWLDITEWVENGHLNPTDALKQFIALLNNKSEEFESEAKETLSLLTDYIKTNPSITDIKTLISNFITNSTYSARLFEIAIHSYFQTLNDRKLLGYSLKPLSQMRSANKKHGNIGDIELTEGEGTFNIIESWDAKYGKTYFRDELEELNDKLASHPESVLVGFISNGEPDMKEEILKRIFEIKEIHNVDVMILSFKDWVEYQQGLYIEDNHSFLKQWLQTFIECICQKRRKLAPIDEPTLDWVLEFKNLLKAQLNNS